MGDLTANISVHELACDCEYEDCKSKSAAHMPLVMALQEATDYFGHVHNCRARIIITDGNRCFEHNVDIQMRERCVPRELAVKSNSMHLHHIAADHHIDILQGGEWNRMPADELYQYYHDKFPGTCGVGLYSNRVHLDMRKIGGRW